MFVNFVWSLLALVVNHTIDKYEIFQTLAEVKAAIICLSTVSQPESSELGKGTYITTSKRADAVLLARYTTNTAC